MEKSILIIGAGIAGLSAGCYAQMNGFRTRILEMHNLPGGVCTSWRRKGYTFDGCIHWLGGTRPGTQMHRMWRDLGAFESQRVIQHDVYKRVVIGDRCLNVWRDLDRLEQELLNISPEDKDVIREFVGQIRRFAGIQAPLDRFKMTLTDYARMLPYFPGILKYNRISQEEFFTRFKHPFLRSALLAVFPVHEMPVFVAMLTLALMANGDAGYPEGGSLEFSRSIERRYCSLGGEMVYQARVEKILIENGRAVGVRLADGSEQRADYVISAADGHTTLFDMLGEAYVDPHTRRCYQDFSLFTPLLYVSLGINRDMSGEPPIVTKVLEQPVVYGGEEHTDISWCPYGYDPTLAPEGKTSLVIMQGTGYEYWAQIYPDRARYETAKQQVAERLVAELEKAYPGIRADIEVMDVATPMTWVRYTANWRGAYEGWLPSRQSIARPMKKTLPGLDNFYMCGQWVEPGGGVPVVAGSGRGVIQLICQQEKKRFQTG